MKVSNYDRVWIQLFVVLDLFVYLSDIKKTTVNTIPKGFILCKRKLPCNLIQFGGVVLKSFALVLEVSSRAYDYFFSIETIYWVARIFYYGFPVLIKESFKRFIGRDEQSI